MSEIREKLKNMKPEERKEFIHQEFIRIFGENPEGLHINEKKLVLSWYDELEKKDEIKADYELGLARRKEYLETGDVSSGFMVSYDDFK